jgi:hypothetical protein
VHTAPARPPGQPASTIYLHVRSISSWPAGRGHWAPNESPTPKQPSLRLQVPGGVEGTEHPTRVQQLAAMDGGMGGRSAHQGRCRGRRSEDGDDIEELPIDVGSLIGWGVEAYAGCSREPVCAPPAATLLLAAGLAGAWPPGPEPTCVVLDLRCSAGRPPSELV